MQLACERDLLLRLHYRPGNFFARGSRWRTYGRVASRLPKSRMGVI